MAIGDTFPIITDKEFSLMSPPRRPRGEKPATTIRFLRRQIFELGKTIADLRSANATLSETVNVAETLATGYRNETDFLEEQLSNARTRIEDLTRQLAETRLKTAYLQGFYDASPAGDFLAQIAGRSREGDPQACPPGAEARQGGRAQSVPGLHEAAGTSPWRQPAVHPDDHPGQAPDRETGGTAAPEFEIGEARDGTLHINRTAGARPGAHQPLYRR